MCNVACRLRANTDLVVQGVPFSWKGNGSRSQPRLKGVSPDFFTNIPPNLGVSGCKTQEIRLSPTFRSQFFWRPSSRIIGGLSTRGGGQSRRFGQTKMHSSNFEMRAKIPVLIEHISGLKCQICGFECQNCRSHKTQRIWHLEFPFGILATRLRAHLRRRNIAIAPTHQTVSTRTDHGGLH